MHHLPSLFSFFAVPNRFTSRKMHALEKNKIIFSLKFQIVSTIVRRHNAPFTVLVFKGFSAVQNRFKYRQDAWFRDIFFCSSKSFQIPSQRMLQRHCFKKILCNSKSFQIPSACMLQRYCFHFFLCCVPNNFNYRFLLKFSAVQIVSNIVRMHA